MGCVLNVCVRNFSRENRSGMRSDTHSIAATPRISRFARSMRPHAAVDAWSAYVATRVAPQQ
eukprot:4689088-Lingulodinium_polyedra.AAC.1